MLLSLKMKGFDIVLVTTTNSTIEHSVKTTETTVAASTVVSSTAVADTTQKDADMFATTAQESTYLTEKLILVDKPIKDQKTTATPPENRKYVSKTATHTIPDYSTQTTIFEPSVNLTESLTNVTDNLKVSVSPQPLSDNTGHGTDNLSSIIPLTSLCLVLCLLLGLYFVCNKKKHRLKTMLHVGSTQVSSKLFIT